MEPLAALGVASNIIQLVDFGIRLLSRSQEIHQSADGRTDEHVLLESAANTLADLYDGLTAVETPDTRRLTKADQTLVTLKDQSEATIEQLHKALDKARMKGKHSKWRSVYEALKSVHSDKEIAKLANELESIRKQIDTALLVVLAKRLETLDHDHTVGCRPRKTKSPRQDEQEANLLDAVYLNKWQVSQRDDVQAFSQQLNHLTTMDLKARFCEMLTARLYFPHMPDRHESIPQAHAETFEWLFRAPSTEASIRASNFKEWIQREDDSIYWITGKPGSGKSTLMKFVSDHPQLDKSLQQWAHAGNVTKAGFYFWNSGSAMQMSQLGMLQTLLHTCIQDRNDLIMSIFQDRWEQYVAFGGGQYPFRWMELKKAFRHVISDHTRKFFFLIDGLDEFDGEPTDLVELLLEFAVRPNVKFCLASRPWLPFEDAFKSRPNLLLEQLTKSDIRKYVTARFGQNEHYIRLENEDATVAQTLVEEVINKASGVFLWVRLVVNSLLQGLSNSDRMYDMQARLNTLPSDLEALFEKLLGPTDTEYFKQACELFRLLRTYREFYSNMPGCFRRYGFAGVPTLLRLFYADDPNTQSYLDAPWEPLSDDKARFQAEHMRRRLVARCKGLLEVNDGSFDAQVTYLHRTARDYVESDSYWRIILDTTEHDSFEPDKRWANSQIWVHKGDPYTLHDRKTFESSVLLALRSGSIMQKRTGKVQKTYLDEVFGMEYIRRHVYQITTSRLAHALSYLSHNPGLLGYLAVLFETAEPAERIAVCKNFKKNKYKLDSEVLGKDQTDRLLRIMAPYRNSWKPRLLRQRPVLLEYE